MRKTRCVTLGKPERNAVNEDAVVARKNMIAVSDGAGGGGLFADRWSAYLLKNLPETPIGSAGELDGWIGAIWERYYNQAEVWAKRIGGMALDKFYDEGSFATLAAVWRGADGVCRWMTYGDSVVFIYDRTTKGLYFSFSELKDFDRPPYLINCKDELEPEGFRCGCFELKKGMTVFVASDALAHYIMMMYEMSAKERFADELDRAIKSSSKNGNIVKECMCMPSAVFEKSVIAKIRKNVYDKNGYGRWIMSLYDKGLIAFDDYSLAVMHY